MLVGKFVEVVLKYLFRILNIRCLLHIAYLKQKTFPKVTGSHANRLKLLHHLQHLQHFLLIRLHIRTEGKVINNAVYASAKITVIIKTAYDERADSILMLGEIPIAKLLLKALRKTLLYRKSIVLRTFIFGIIQVGTKTIAWNRIIFLIFGKRHFSWSLIRFCLGRLFFIKHRILFNLFTDTLLQLLDREFDEFDGLNLQRRKLLLLLEF